MSPQAVSHVAIADLVELKRWDKQGIDHVIDRSVLSPPPPACALPVGLLLSTAQAGVRANLSLLPL